MIRIFGNVFLSAAFLLSALLLPWWATVLLGIAVIGIYRSYAVAIIGGIMMDLLFGIPQPALFGFAYVYTLLFAILSAVAFYLDRRILE